MMKSITSAICLSLITLTCAAMESNTIVLPEKHDSLGSIQTTCFELLDELDARPICNYNNAQYKFLPNKDYNYCRLIEVVCKETYKQLTEQGIQKDIFCSDCIHSLHRGSIQENLYNEPPYRSCSMEELKKIFSSVIHEITVNWRHSTLVEHPNILSRKNESKWSLLVKKNIITCEETAFSFILAILQLNTNALCSDGWKGRNNGLIYFWIKKKHFEEVVQKLALEVS